MSEAAINAAQQKRFAVFQLSEADQALLRGNAEFARNQLPKLMEEWRGGLAQWPEIQSAAMDSEVHGARVAHWVRVASG